MGDTVKFAISATSWFTVNWAVTVPAVTVMRPVRAAEVLGAAAYAIEPFPDPDAPEEIVSHGESLDAVHAQELVTAVLNEPPALLSDCVVGSRESAQAASCVKPMSIVGVVAFATVTMIRPNRTAPGFGATVYMIVPVDVPVNPEVIVMYPWFENAVHEQLLLPVTVTVD